MKKLTDVLSRLFNDPHVKVLTVLIDALTHVVTTQSAELTDWLPVMLPRLLTKSGSEAVSSLHSKMMHAFDVIRSACICISFALYLAGNGTMYDLVVNTSVMFTAALTLYRMVMPIGTPFLKEKINN